jgi:Domain of unknown function (DUF5063)
VIREAIAAGTLSPAYYETPAHLNVVPKDAAFAMTTSGSEMRGDFVEAARAYLTRIAALSDGSPLDVRELHALLADLQSGAAGLLDGTADEETEAFPGDIAFETMSYDELRARLRCLPFDAYSVMFDAFDATGGPVETTVSDDLADIYIDLAEGFETLREEGPAAARATWKRLYYFHWGRHAVHAQTAIWQYLANHYLD